MTPPFLLLITVFAKWPDFVSPSPLTGGNVGFGGSSDWSYCTKSRRCTYGQGDCDGDRECSGGTLVCGKNNCRDFNPHAQTKADCCTYVAGFGGPNDMGWCSDPGRPCTLGRGNCRSDAECSGSLVCGTRNCRDFNAQAAANTNCCTDPVGFGGPNDWSNCTTSGPCTLGQGDCDKDTECSGSLVCGKDNCKDFNTRAEAKADCCTNPEPPPSLLASDSSNDYYKVAVRYGVEMNEGAVKDACDSAGMNTVCYHKDINDKNNVNGCVPMASPKYHASINDVSAIICNTEDAHLCSELHGVFSARNGFSIGGTNVECGVMPDRFCALRSGFVSGPGSDYSVDSILAQYYGLCSVPRVPPTCLLTSDSANDYYKVAVRHGVKMNEGAVKDACDSAGMNTVCVYKDINNKNNVDGCVPMAKQKYYASSMTDVSALICKTEDAHLCSQLYGVFSAVNGFNIGGTNVECGVMPDSHCAWRSGFVSGPGLDYSVGSKSAQYYGLCSVPREPDNCYCGLAKRRPDKISPTFRIAGGDETDVNEYPWQVLIYSLRGYSKTKKKCVYSKFLCGGSVIGDQWVLTAAHCLDLECDLTPAQVEVHLGEHKRGTDEDETIQMDVAEIIRHEKYDPNESLIYGYDIALLKLTNKIDFGSHLHIRPICLPADGSNKDYTGYTATATGWGRTSIDENTSPHLLEVDLTVGTENECSQTYSRLDFEQVLCAKGVGGKGTCKGDSGGPLVIKEDGHSGTEPGENYELIGVNSFGKKKKEEEPEPCKDFATGFVRVTAQLEWIRNTTKCSWRTCPRT